MLNRALKHDHHLQLGLCQAWVTEKCVPTHYVQLQRKSVEHFMNSEINAYVCQCFFAVDSSFHQLLWNSQDFHQSGKLPTFKEIHEVNIDQEANQQSTFSSKQTVFPFSEQLSFTQYFCRNCASVLLQLHIMHRTTSIQSLASGHFTWAHITQVPDTKLCACTLCSTKIKRTEIFNSRTVSHVTYSCHHNSSRFTFPIFVHSWHFSVFHSLQSITPGIY